MSQNGGVDFQLYRYVPSLAAAIVFIVLFVVITAYHLYQVVRLRSWYFLVFVTGGICESLWSVFPGAHKLMMDSWVQSKLSVTFAVLWPMVTENPSLFTRSKQS